MLFDVERRWWPKAICRWEDRGLFFAEGGMVNRKPSGTVQELWDQAKEICAMCPALNECQRDTLGEPFGVFGGRDQYERYRIRSVMAAAVKRWPVERQLTWGRQLHYMREGGVSWSTIQLQSGMPITAAAWLIERWKELRPKTAAPVAIVDLELPVLVRERPSFPTRPGRRHAWARHNGLVSDAWYRGETSDGAWVQVTTTAGRGQTQKWIKAEDVYLYRPQAVVILNYVERPDDERTRDPAA